MKLYNLIITRKDTKERSVLEYGITEAKAERECEQWGWFYNDGEHSYYMSYEESIIKEDMLEVIQYATRGDLLDGLEVETNEEIKHFILQELLSR